MAERLLFIGWDGPVRGREERGLEVFNDTAGLFARMQQDGRIEKVEVVLLQGNGNGIGGYWEVHGTAAQLGALREDDELQRLLVTANLIVDGLSVADGFADAGIARQLEIYRDAVASVPQHA